MGAKYKKGLKFLTGSHWAALNANQTRYGHPCGNPLFVAEVGVRMNVPFNCVVTDLHVRAANVAGAGESYEITLFLNGAPTLLTVIIAGAVQLVANSNAVVGLVDADEIDFQLISSLNAAAVSISYSMEWIT